MSPRPGSHPVYRSAPLLLVSCALLADEPRPVIAQDSGGTLAPFETGANSRPGRLKLAEHRLPQRDIALAGSCTLEWPGMRSSHARSASSTPDLADLDLSLDLDAPPGVTGARSGENADKPAAPLHGYWIFDRILRFRFATIDANTELRGVDADPGIFSDVGPSDGAVRDVPLVRALGNAFHPGDNRGSSAFVSSLQLSTDPGGRLDGNETAIEFRSRLDLTPLVHVTPNIRWIEDPTRDPVIDNAVVGVLEFDVDF